METMTKEEYFRNLAVTAITELVELDKKVKNFAGASDVDCSVHADIQDWFDVNGDESTDIYNVRLNDAYDDYVESSEKDHIYDVEFSFTVSGTAQVHAKDQDEAENYVDENLRITPEVDFYEDDKVVTDVETNDWDEQRDFSVDDTGDEWEE